METVAFRVVGLLLCAQLAVVQSQGPSCNVPATDTMWFTQMQFRDKTEVPQYTTLAWRCANSYKATNMQPQGDTASSFCMNGAWIWQTLDNKPLVCVKVPDTVVCSEPPIAASFMAITQRTGKPISAPWTDMNEYITIECMTGYSTTPAGGKTVLSCTDGKWQPGNEVINCQKSALCLAPILVDGEMIETRSNTGPWGNSNEFLIMACETGYTAQNANGIMTCLNGVWTRDRPPGCRKDQPNDVCHKPTLAEGQRIQRRTAGDGPWTNNQEYIMLECISGYVMTNNPGILQCTNGIWSTVQDPLCRPQNQNICSSPPIPFGVKFTRTNSGAWTASETGTLECIPGYKAVGSPLGLLICTSGSWTTATSINCVATGGTTDSSRKCIIPVATKVSHTVLTGNGTSHGDTILMSCDAGLISQYTPNERRNTCWYGIWLKPWLKCTPPAGPLSCSARDATSVTEGLSAYVRTNQTIIFPKAGTEMQYSCEAGYRLVGSAVVKCLNNGKWSDSRPTCQEKATCPTLPTLVNAQYKWLNRPDVQLNSAVLLTPGTTVTVQCSIGYGIAAGSPQTIICLASGEWSANVPLCLQEKSCVQPPINNGRVNILSGKGLVVGTVISFQCDYGYTLSGQNLLTCQDDPLRSDGRWSADFPQCIRDCYCQYPQAPVSGSVKVSDTSGNLQSPSQQVPCDRSALFECNTGFSLKGTSQLFCRDTIWSHQDPICERADRDCAEPRNPMGGSWRTIGGSRFTSGATIELTCSGNQAPSDQDNRRTCVRGVWQSSDPSTLTCVSTVTCPIPNNLRAVPPGIPNGGDQRWFSCLDTTNRIEGASNAGHTCRDDRSWSPPAPTCSDVVQDPQCSELTSQVQRGIVQYSLVQGLTSNQIRGVGATANIRCENECFDLIGQQRLTCTSAMQWDQQPPNCKEVRYCRLPPQGSELTFTRYDSRTCTPTGLASPRTIMTYSCSGGKFPSDSTRACKDDSTWDKPEPVCVAVKQCGLPPTTQLQNGRFRENYAATSKPGSKLNVQCDYGYKVTPMPGRSAEIECKEDAASATWTLPALCVQQFCAEPAISPTIVSKRVNNLNSGYLIGSVVQLSCKDASQNLAGDPTNFCDLDAAGNVNWRFGWPICGARNMCSGSTSILNGVLTYDFSEAAATSRFLVNEYPTNTTAIYRCSEGYYLSSSARLRCGVDNKWSPATPACLPSCPQPPLTQYGRWTMEPEINSDNNWRNGYQIRLVCDKGYKNDNNLNSVQAVECRSGNWDMLQKQWGTCVSDSRLPRKRTCTTPPTIPHGNVTFVNKQTIGAIPANTFAEEQTNVEHIIIMCDSGYERQPDTRFACVDGVWSPLSWPACVEKKCQQFEVIGGRVDTMTDNNWQTGHSVSISCTAGTPTCRTAMCTSGEWDCNPSCEVERQCRAPYGEVNGDWTRVWSPNNGNDVNNTRTGLEEPRTTFQLKCRANFKLQTYESSSTMTAEERELIATGIYFVICGVNGQWNVGRLPTCVAQVKCNPLAISHGTWSVLSNHPVYTPGSKIQINCEERFSLVGAKELTCDSAGVWDQPVPICKAIACNPIHILDPSSNNGYPGLSRQTASDFPSVATTVRYSCAPGYVLYGTETITCNSNGLWSSTLPPQCRTADGSPQPVTPSPSGPDVCTVEPIHLGPNAETGLQLNTMNVKVGGVPSGYQLNYNCLQNEIVNANNQANTRLVCDSQTRGFIPSSMIGCRTQVAVQEQRCQLWDITNMLVFRMDGKAEPTSLETIEDKAQVSAMCKQGFVFAHSELNTNTFFTATCSGPTGNWLVSTAGGGFVSYNSFPYCIQQTAA